MPTEPTAPAARQPATDLTGPTGGGQASDVVVGELVRRAPKVLLHDHLDGGLRPRTIVEIAQQTGYTGLPTTDVERLGRWFREAADSGSLVRYLETFDHTIAVMQTRESLVRVASECAQDLAADGVVYAEVRYAPEQHLRAGLTPAQVVEAVAEGLRDGEQRAAAAGTPIRTGQLVTAMRHGHRGLEMAELAVRYRDEGVAGFDIAGAEDGYPPSLHLAAFEHLRRHSAHFTIHAGEAFGLPSIHEAVARCGADRLGHGVRIVEDLTVAGRPYTDDPVASAGADVADVELGRLAAYVRDNRIALELCPSSNVQTGAAPSVAAHPIGLLTRLGFRVTLNTDNRLMSGTTLSREMQLMVDRLGWGAEQLRAVTLNAAKSAFVHFDERVALIDDLIVPGYAALAGPPR